MDHQTHCEITNPPPPSFTQTTDEGMILNLGRVKKMSRRFNPMLVWLGMMCCLIPFGSATQTYTFGEGVARTEYGLNATVDDVLCDDDCNVNCTGKDSCTYRLIECGTATKTATCDVLCSWTPTPQQDMGGWNPNPGYTLFYPPPPYPPCGMAQFIVAQGSQLTINAEGKGALMMATVMADEGSTVDMNVSADWGLAWSNISAKDADELDITVQGEAVLWDADIYCPETTADEPNCRVTLVTEQSEVDDYYLSYPWNGEEYYFNDLGGPYMATQFTGGSSQAAVDTGAFLTAQMTGTHIHVRNVDDVVLNCGGPLNNVFFSDVDNKPSTKSRSRISQLEFDGGTVCPLDYPLGNISNLTCDGDSIRGTCGQWGVVPPTSAPPTSAPSAPSASSAPTSSSPALVVQMCLICNGAGCCDQIKNATCIALAVDSQLSNAECQALRCNQTGECQNERRRLLGAGAANEFQVIFPPGTAMNSRRFEYCEDIIAQLGVGTNCKVGTIDGNGDFVPSPPTTAGDTDDFFDDPLAIAALVVGAVALAAGGSFAAYKWHTMHMGSEGNAP